MTNQDNETQNTEKQDLADRVDHLEETISKMLPTRRDALKFGGAAALGGAAMSGRASAGTSEVGTIGTSTDLVDINAEDISAAAIETDEGSVGSSALSPATRNDRPLITNGDVSVVVDAGGGADYTTVQEALDDIPLYVRHQFKINISDGTYNEDCVVHPFIAGDFNSGGSYERAGVVISGDPTTPSNVKIDSMVVAGTNGAAVRAPAVQGVRFTSPNPYTNENSCLEAYGVGHMSVASCEFDSENDDVDKAIQSYSSKLTINNTTIGGFTNDPSTGVITKHLGEARITGNTSITASTFAIDANSGIVLYDGGSVSLSGGFSNSEGYIVDINDGLIRGVNGFVSGRMELRDSGGTGREAIGLTSTDRLQIGKGTDSSVGADAGVVEIYGDQFVRVINSGANVATFTPGGFLNHSGETEFGDGGARIFVDGSGELVAEDDAGNQTTLT